MERDLDVAGAKCRNFLIDGWREGGSFIKDEKSGNIKFKFKEQSDNKMSQDLGRLFRDRDGVELNRLPLKWVYGLRLLGVAVDCEWTACGLRHFYETELKAF